MAARWINVPPSMSSAVYGAVGMQRLSDEGSAMWPSVLNRKDTRGGTRTRTARKPRDFKSLASTDFATRVVL